MLDSATTSDVGRVEGIALDGVARVLPAFLNHELDDVYVDGGSEDGLQLLLGRLAQETLTALVGEEYLEGYGTKSSGWQVKHSARRNSQSTTLARGIVLID